MFESIFTVVFYILLTAVCLLVILGLICICMLPEAPPDIDRSIRDLKDKTKNVMDKE